MPLPNSWILHVNSRSSAHTGCLPRAATAPYAHKRRFIHKHVRYNTFPPLPWCRDIFIPAVPTRRRVIFVSRTRRSRDRISKNLLGLSAITRREFRLRGKTVRLPRCVGIEPAAESRDRRNERTRSICRRVHGHVNDRPRKPSSRSNLRERTISSTPEIPGTFAVP